MKSYIPCAEIVSHLRIDSGDLLLVGSDVLQLALSARHAGDKFDPNQFIDDLLAALGPSGTLLLPTFNFDFCSGQTYDVRNSSTAMGTLPRICLQRPDFRRTQHPIHSFAVAGRFQSEICSLSNNSSFGVGSPFEFLHENDGQMLIIGLPIQGSFTFAHFVEELENAPFRYRKEFSGSYVDAAGNRDERTYSMFVRDLENGVVSDLTPLEQQLLDANILRETKINGVGFKHLRLSDSYQIIARDIQENAGRSLHRLEHSE